MGTNWNFMFQLMKQPLYDGISRQADIL